MNVSSVGTQPVATYSPKEATEAKGVPDGDGDGDARGGASGASGVPSGSSSVPPGSTFLTHL